MKIKPARFVARILPALALIPAVVFAGPAKWTVLIYGHADHSLTTAMRSDLLEMERAGSSDDFKIVVQVDINTKIAAKWFWDFKYKIDPKKFKGVKRLLIEKDTGNLSYFNSTILESESLSEDHNMDDPAVLQAFIEWGMARYPAERYGLVLWNHGNQFVGYGGDTQEGTLDHPMGMTTGQVNTAISQALAKAGRDKMDFIGFDTCLMGGAEILGDFNTLCDVFFACPELDYGDGWDYGATLGFLKANPDVEIKEFAKEEVGFWNAHHGEPMDQTHKVHAAYDMAKYDAFAQSFKSFSEQLKLYGHADGQEVPKLRAEATHYSLSDRSQIKSPTHFIDLGDFAKKIANASVNADLKQASLNLVQAIDGMILAKATGSLRTHVSALSIAYPHNTDDWVEHYEKKYDSISFTQGIGTDWRQFLALYGAMSAADQTAPVLSAGDNSRSFSTAGRTPDEPDAAFMNASLDEPAILDFSVSGEDVFELSATLVVPDNPDDPNEYFYIGEVGRFKIEQEGSYELQWPGTNPMITSPDMDYMLELGGWFMDREGKQMISFADYQPPESEEVIQLFLFTTIDEEGFGKVHTILEDSGQELPDGAAVAATPASSSLEFEKGGKLYPVYFSEIWDAVNEEWQPQSFHYEDGFILTPENGMEGIEVEFAQATEGQYSLELQASDFMGNLSEVLEYNMDVPIDKPDAPVANQYVSTLEFTDLPPLYTVRSKDSPNWFYLDWDDDGTLGATLQQTGNLLSGEWMDVPVDLIDIENNIASTWVEMTADAQFFRLIKK
ncbi:MAG: hypothetical protein CL474_03610 [Acidobacteria bacterium]|nr:hypothetical protein [Acidobacteriota bacterium]